MIRDGTLRWIITPRKGKVYYLTPISKNNEFVPQKGTAYFKKQKGKKHFFVNGKRKSPEEHQGLGPCIIDKRGRALMQIFLNNNEVLVLEDKIVSHNDATEIGAWQLDSKSEVVIAQKVNGKWGVWRKNKRISPECQMVWGWQYTLDDNFIVPVEYRKGDNLVLLKDGETVYDGKGDLLTWHYENRNLWVLVIEGNYYRFYLNSKVHAEFPLSNGTLTNWNIVDGEIQAKFSQKKFNETPRTCHPVKEYVATNEWWFE